MTLYLCTTETARKIERDPKWRGRDQIGTDDEGRPIYGPWRPATAAEYAARGWYPILDEPPPYDPETQYIRLDPIEDWPIEDGQAIKTYTVHDYTEQEILEREGRTAAQKSAAVTAKRDALIGGGVSIDFGGDVGPKVLQTATEYDRMNWLTILSAAQAFAAMGAGAEPMNPIRTADNVMIPVTVNEAIAHMLAIQTKAGAVWKHAADLKDALAAADDQEALDAIDIDGGWPDPLA